MDDGGRAPIHWPIAPSPWTLPTHATIFTGLWPHEHGAEWWTPLDRAAPTLAEELAARGYATAGFVANVSYCSRESGLARGFSHYEDFTASPGRVLESSSLIRAALRSRQVRKMTGFYELPGRKRAPELNRSVLRWVTGQEEGRPWLVFVNYYDAHAPYLPEKPFDTLFGPAPRGEPWIIEEAARRSPPDDVDELLESYEETIAYIDHHVGALLDSLDERGQLTNTIVVVTSDHGEAFGEHGQMGHGEDIHMELLHVPLILAGTTRVPRGVSIAEPVSLRDLPATLLDLAGKHGDVIPGSSLAARWLGNGSGQGSALFGSDRRMRSLVDGEYHYVLDRSRTERLYAFKTDPMEQHDLARAPGADSLLARMHWRVDPIFPSPPWGKDRATP
ncbi:MAG: sulfatase [Gemmatimonadota bacterium]|nr:sulfatase [Gemmatimonadota bacterium]